MADPSLGQVTASVWENVVPGGPEDNIFASQALLNLLKTDGGFQKLTGGSKIELTIEYAENSSIRSYSDLETLDTTRYDVFDAAQYSWKEVGGTIVYSELEKQKVAGSSAKFDLIAAKVNNGKRSMIAAINRMLYSDGTGNSSKDIAGLGLHAPSTTTTGTVGGINRAVFAWWRPYSATCAKSSTAYDNLRGAMRTAYNTCSRGGVAETPDWFVTDVTTLGGYESTLTANERFTSQTKTGEVDGGFRNDRLRFKGASVVGDEDCTSAVMYMLNARNFKFFYLSWMKAFAPVEPANQTAEIVKLLTIGNIGVNNPRRLYKIYSIT